MEEQKHSPLPFVLDDLGPCDGWQIRYARAALAKATGGDK